MVVKGFFAVWLCSALVLCDSSSQGGSSGGGSSGGGSGGSSHGIGQNCCGACDDPNAVCVPFGCTFVCDCDDGFAYCPGCGDECGNCLPYANVEEQCFCDAQCPPTSFCNSDTHECECFPGYLFDGSACVTDPEGPGAGLNDACDGDGGSGDRAAINCINWPVLKCQVVLGTGPPPIKVCSCNGPRGYVYNETTMECECTKTVGGCAND